ncbi:ABC transporter ATP-binding protein [Pelagibacterium xiamenense]|uniref:ABC transporter ATP-binding protein n=1 Tax=Pelagibacterium xiamenense TaxID=2901140 RepID=UPI001E52BFCB|nr:ABC transporter ATP-binding protein [Pelagibacterium xiamenense]MCD7060661.1 ABC transporter ATP-binding protein [Pelagibacterium xiamenense]
MADAIVVENLNKSFGDKHVVRDVSLTVAEGKVTGFLGPNGSGKTTTMRMLCGLLTPDSGAGSCFGLDIVRDSRRIKRLTGYMTQKFSLYEDMTIEENLMFVARVYGMTDRRRRVTEALVKLGLETRRRQVAGALSGGWKQRLALAAATLHEPRLLLLDEPTAGVDPKARREFWDEIHALAAEGLTVMVSTHYMDEAERCHDIAYIAYGQLIARGTVDELVDRSGLSTYVGEGAGADRLVAELAGQPGVEMVAPFGSSIHVSGPDAEALKAAIAPFDKAPYTWHPGRPTIEDVFIHLMNRSEDNFQ